MGAIDKWVSELTPATPMSEVAERALALRLRNVVHYLPLAAHLADEQLEYVHSARVASRRASAALDVYRDFMPAAKRRRMKRALKEIRGSMGEARDLDVFLAGLGEADQPGLNSLVIRLTKRRQKAQRPIIECAMPLLANQKLRRQTTKLLRQVNDHASKQLRQRPFSDWAAQMLKQVWDEFIAGVPGDSPSAEELHDFRITTKRFRYALELLSNGLPGSIRKYVYPLTKQLQAQLGDLQDHAVAAEKLVAWKHGAKSRDERALLRQFEREHRKQYSGKSEAFLRWWRHDRIDELREAVELLWVAKPAQEELLP